MVWNSTQSALYKFVAEHNREVVSGGSRTDDDEENAENIFWENIKNKPEKIPSKNTEKIYENQAEKIPKKIPEKFGENIRKNNFENHRRNVDCGCRFGGNMRKTSSGPDGLLSDGDFLLICTLIYVLYRNGADQKLIFALIFILIC